MHGLAKLPGCTEAGSFKDAGIIFRTSVHREVKSAQIQLHVIIESFKPRWDGNFEVFEDMSYMSKEVFLIPSFFLIPVRHTV